MTLSDPAPYSPSRISSGQYQSVTFTSAKPLYAISIKGCASYNECRYNKNNRPQYVQSYYLRVDDGSGVYKDYKVGLKEQSGYQNSENKTESGSHIHLVPASSPSVSSYLRFITLSNIKFLSH